MSKIFAIAALLLVVYVSMGCSQFIGFEGEAPQPGGILHFFLRPPVDIPGQLVRAQGRLGSKNGFNYISQFDVSEVETTEDSQCYRLEDSIRVDVGSFTFEKQTYKITPESEAKEHTHLVVDLKKNIVKKTQVFCDLRFLSSFTSVNMLDLDLQLVEEKTPGNWENWSFMPDPISFSDMITPSKWNVTLAVTEATGDSIITFSSLPEKTIVGPLSLSIESGDVVLSLNEPKYLDQFCKKSNSNAAQLSFICTESGEIYARSSDVATPSNTFPLVLPNAAEIAALPVGVSGTYNYVITSSYFRIDPERTQTIRGVHSVSPTPDPEPADNAMTASFFGAILVVAFAIFF